MISCWPWSKIQLWSHVEASRNDAKVWKDQELFLGVTKDTVTPAIQYIMCLTVLNSFIGPLKWNPPPQKNSVTVTVTVWQVTCWVSLARIWVKKREKKTKKKLKNEEMSMHRGPRRVSILQTQSHIYTKLNTQKPKARAVSTAAKAWTKLNSHRHVHQSCERYVGHHRQTGVYE